MCQYLALPGSHHLFWAGRPLNLPTSHIVPCNSLSKHKNRPCPRTSPVLLEYIYCYLKKKAQREKHSVFSTQDCTSKKTLSWIKGFVFQEDPPGAVGLRPDIPGYLKRSFTDISAFNPQLCVILFIITVFKDEETER